GYAILDRIVRAFVERTLEPSLGDQSRSPLERIYRLLDRVLESQRQCNCVGGCPMGNLASELSDVHEGFRQRLAEVFTLWRERVSRALGEAQARGELAARAEPRKVAQFIVAALEGAILMAKVTKEIDVMEQCVAELKAYLALNTVAQPASAYPHGVRG
ncbi:MAG: TetR family transcriptional regulator C-terminal domain-containing protein, partial [Candidatus Rokubacteria bacterium]|nr:TetR family transcriptional regulator C-terminal domain-containing protein [Candidatus Rokubacteria bacterium]